MRFLRRAAIATAVMTLLALAAPHSSVAESSVAEQENSQRAECYRYIRVLNSGAFVIRWTGRIEMSGGGVVSGNTTDYYGITGYRTLDFADYGLNNGQRIWPHVKVYWGESRAGSKVRYCDDGGTAVYNATGTTQNLSVTLQN